MTDRLFIKPHWYAWGAIDGFTLTFDPYFDEEAVIPWTPAWCFEPTCELRHATGRVVWKLEDEATED